jgi:hypothetical protein
MKKRAPKKRAPKKPAANAAAKQCLLAGLHLDPSMLAELDPNTARTFAAMRKEGPAAVLAKPDEPIPPQEVASVKTGQENVTAALPSPPSQEEEDESSSDVDESELPPVSAHTVTFRNTPVKVQCDYQLARGGLMVRKTHGLGDGTSSDDNIGEIRAAEEFEIDQMCARMVGQTMVRIAKSHENPALRGGWVTFRHASNTYPLCMPVNIGAENAVCNIQSQLQKNLNAKKEERRGRETARLANNQRKKDKQAKRAAALVGDVAFEGPQPGDGAEASVAAR